MATKTDIQVQLDALELAVINELSVGQIAHKWSLSTRTVKRYIAHAKHLLIKQFYNTIFANQFDSVKEMRTIKEHMKIFINQLRIHYK